MAPLLCPSPVILDHSFPRDQEQLRIAAVALGQLGALIERGEANLLMTSVTSDIVEDFNCGQGARPYALLHDLYALLTQWLLQPHDGLVTLDVTAVQDYQAHAVPETCTGAEGLVELWSDELGRTLVVHDQASTERGFFIGVACEVAFSGGKVGKYHDDRVRAFPLVGPSELKTLQDAYAWEVGQDLHRRSVSVDAALRNVSALGATRIRPRRRDSHYHVSFPKRRTWTLDSNVDPVPDGFLRELVPITGLPLPVIKHALLTGARPPQVCRLKPWFASSKTSRAR